MSLSMQTANPDPVLLAAVRDAPWDLHSTTVVADYDTAELGGGKRRWQIAFNDDAGQAAVIDLAGSGSVKMVQATSIADAAVQASRVSG